MTLGAYIVPSAVLLAGLGGAAYAGSGQLDNVAGSVGIVAAVCSISASESRVGGPPTPPWAPILASTRTRCSW